MRRLTRWGRVLSFLGLLVVLGAGGAAAEVRAALVIGNAAYRNVGRLANPAADAQAIADTLKGLGFDTTLVLDQDKDALSRSLKAFTRKATGADIAAVYYAGHGMEADGENYLIPVDAELASDQDIDFELVPLDLVLRSVAGAKQLRLVMLDACRNNPFAARMASSGSGRAIGRGFVRVEPSNNTLVAYAAKDGTIADDGDGAHSPFAAALIKTLPQPGLEVSFLFRKVRDEVLSTTASRQEPFVYGSLGGNAIYLAPSVGDAPVPAAAPVASASNEGLFWQSIKDSRNPAMFQAYLRKYPNGDFADLAQAKVAELQPTQTAALTPAPATPAATETGTEIEEMAATTYVALQSANVRASASTDAKIVGRLNPDDAVTVTGRVKDVDWNRIKLGGSSGYVSSRLIAPIDVEELTSWRKVRTSEDQTALEDFIKHYPRSKFVDRAKDKIAAIAASNSATSNSQLTPPAPTDASTSQTPAKKLATASGDALRSLISNTTYMMGSTHLYLAYDGSLRFKDTSKLGPGKWSVEGTKYCLQLGMFSERVCRDIRQEAGDFVPGNVFGF